MEVTIEQIVSGVRNALYGREVREWIARLGEYCVVLAQKAKKSSKKPMPPPVPPTQPPTQPPGA